MIFEDDLQRTFRQYQSKHRCTDCGLDDHGIMDAVASSNMSMQVVGGGSILQDRREALSEIHVFPHGGVELPSDLLRQVGTRRFDELAQLVHDNSDIGTRAIHRSLAMLALRGELKGVVLAAFHTSRLLADANRPLSKQPMAPYSGSSELYDDYLEEHRQALVMELLAPWINSVNDLLDNAPKGVVSYHHHTMDIYSLSPRDHDIGDDQERPPFQVFWKRPPDGTSQARDIGLAPLKMLERVNSKMSRYFSEAVPGEAAHGSIDFPLTLPLMPFHGSRNDGLARKYIHVIYEVRKDLLDTRERIDRWVKLQPWAVMQNST